MENGQGSTTVAIPGQSQEAALLGAGDTTAPPTGDDALPSAEEGAPFPVSGWDRYEIIRRLGQGGMGAVYEARDRRLGRAVALKFIRGGNPRHTLRLAREARAQASVEHPNVCKVHEVGEIQGKAYIAMELIDGRPLGEVVSRMALHDKVRAVRDVALALHEAHVLGILHRDMKPSNVLVEVGDDGRHRPVVVDFGLARDENDGRGLTESGALLGTPAYMSPEQARGGSLDRRSDVYSLGATLYELLAGVPPFRKASAMKTVLAVLDEDPLPLGARAPSTPEDLATIVAKCLRKEPGERYDSAKALADDLDRYIRGEPILGKRESALAVLRRVARRNRALVLTAAVALVVATLLGGIALRTRAAAARQARELEVQAALGRELGQDVKEMEWFLRAAHLLPLHDTTRERALIKDRMKALEARAAGRGVTAALVDYALGRGHLALEEDAEAVERLARAERGGLDTPELHYALGLARGRLYHRALLEARRRGDARWVERRTRELEDQYLKPALSSMERSHAAKIEAPSYLPGLVAFYEKDYDGALRLAEQAHEEAPWFYEAVKLQADVLLTRGIERKDRGDDEAARRELEEAARRYDVAAESGRSDASLYEGSAEALVRRMEMDTARGAAPDDKLAPALERCEKAAVARPDRSAPYTEMAYAYQFVREHVERRGGDPQAVLALEIAATDRARAVGGGDFATYERRSCAFGALAQYAVAHGLDPRASLDESIADGRRAIELAPTHPWGHVALGFGLYFRAQHAADTGGDPEPDLQAAIGSFRQASQYGHGNALASYGLLGRWLASRGRDPSAQVAPAADVFAACTKANPHSMFCFENMGIVDLAIAEHRAFAGMDAREALARAEAHLEKANGLHPDNLENRQLLSTVHLLRARRSMEHGEDPATELDAFGRMLADCFRLDPKDPVCAVLEARQALLSADAEPQRGRDRALVLSLRAVERNPSDAAYEVLAEARRRLASAAASPADRAKHRAAGLEACARGLAKNPTHPRLHATEGALLLLEAQAERDGEARAKTAARARDALARAFELDPLLRREDGPSLAEAERLAGTP